MDFILTTRDVSHCGSPTNDSAFLQLLNTARNSNFTPRVYDPTSNIDIPKKSGVEESFIEPKAI